MIFLIERKFVAQRIKEHQIHEYMAENLKRAGHSHTKVQRTPLGEKIIVTASRPGLVVGRGGDNIKRLTKILKKKFELENPQIEIAEVENPNIDAQIMAERVANSLEKFGTTKFKGIAHKVMSDVLAAGAQGVEIIMSGKIPSARAKSWRFYQGYLKKCGHIASSGVNIAYSAAQLKTGTVGIQVRIMPAETRLPDEVLIIDEKEEKEEEKTEAKESNEGTKQEAEEQKKEKEKPKPKKEKTREAKPKKSE